MENKYELEFKKWLDIKYCMEAVKEDGYALRYVNKLEILRAVIKKLNIK